MSSYEHMDENDGASRYATCCTGPFRTDIQKAAFAISFLGCALNLIQAIVAFLPDSGTHHQSISLGVVYLIGALIYLSVIVAQRERNHLLFLPYLIYVAICLVFYVLGFIGLIVVAIAAPKSIIDDWNKDHPEYHITVEQFRAAMLLYSLFVGIGLALNAWFYSIIYRAYKHLKHTQAGGVPVPPPV